MEEIKGYNISEKLDHIAYMFNVRTKGKKYENFIVNAIYTKISNSELMPVTQQYVKNLKDPRRYYLLDLYFPQINFGVEIDERQHFSKDGELFDEKRAENIKSAIECDEMRIPIIDKETRRMRSYSEICVDIDNIVEMIKQKIAKANGVHWETNEDRKKVVLANGMFHVNDDVNYSSITEIYNICGGCRSTGKEATSLRRGYYKLTNKYHLWVPTLTIVSEENRDKISELKYLNYLNEDKTIITEVHNKAEGPVNGYNSDCERVVFMRMRDIFGRHCIKFIGIFKFDRVEEDKKCIYKRVGDNIMISDLLPKVTS